MKNRNWFAGAAVLAAVWAPQFAGAAEIFRETQGVSCLPGGAGCARFQGYIYVRRDREAAPAPAPVWDAAGSEYPSDSQSGERLYLRLGAAEAR